MKTMIILGISGLVATGMAFGSDVNLIKNYQNAGAGPFSQSVGKSAWMQMHQSSKGNDTRSCSSCHGTDITQPGKHIKTGKLIEPMAISVNPTRLNDPKKVEKWFRRNCRWTMGRECTPQEKSDFISFINSQ